MIFGVVHSVETLEEFCEFITDVEVTEDEDLEMWPDFIKIVDEVMGIFGDFIEGSESGLDVMLNKWLDVLSDQSVDEDFVWGGGFVCG